jgi:hypothetical protein
MFTKSFWTNASVRSFKTFGQTAIAIVGAGSLNVFDVDFGSLLGVSLGAALLSVLTSVSTSDKIDRIVPAASPAPVPATAPSESPYAMGTNGPPTDPSLVPPGAEQKS